MTENELYDILCAPKKTKRKIAVIKAQMEKLRVMMLPGAIRYDLDHVQSSPKDQMLIFAEKIDELGRKATAQEELYMKQYAEVEELIEGLDDTHQDVVRLQYLAECKPREVAEMLSYSESTVYRLKREAIKTLKG